MLLEGKTAIVYGGGGAIGGATARAFAREGATVFLAGRTLATLERTAKDIGDAGGHVETTQLDALDEKAVVEHADWVASTAGGIDIAINAVGIPHVQGTPFAELSYEEFAFPLTAYLHTNFLTAHAVARQMVNRGSGVVLTISTAGSRKSGVGFLGYGATCAAVEGFSRILAGELGRSGIRVVCLRPDAIPEALATSYTRDAFAQYARRAGTTVEAMVADWSRTGTLLGRYPTLDDVAEFAAFVASDRASVMTGAIANLSGGSVLD